MQEKIDKGEVLKSWSKDNFPIGLDKNLNPFPHRTRQGRKRGQRNRRALIKGMRFVGDPLTSL
ncbi:hypothetical protein [Saccharopolyspora sp. NPDC002376]